MPLLVWFSIENDSLLIAPQKPQVPATVRGIKRKLPGTLFVSPWQLESSGGADATFQRTLLLKIFYAQMIKKFAKAISHFIESYRTAKKIS